MKFKILAFLLLMLLFFSCGENNPLIGEWQTESKDIFGSKVAIDRIIFTKDTERFGSIVSKVEYQISKDEVIVTDETGIGVAYKIIDSNTIFNEIPGLAKITYHRIN